MKSHCSDVAVTVKLTPLENNGATAPILAIAPGEVVVYARNYLTNEIFRKMELKPMSLSVPNCPVDGAVPDGLSMPLDSRTNVRRKLWQSI